MLETIDQMQQVGSKKPIVRYFFWNLMTIFVVTVAFGASASAQEAEVNLSSTVIGNQEQPKVLYIVPWKAVGEAELEEQTIESQLNIVFGHVERVELRRELLFTEQLAKKEEKQKATKK